MSDWWRGAVIYEVYPRSFADSNGDGIGDLPGLLSRMDYIADLGVDAIWIAPFYPSPMRDFGYDIADFCNVDPMFGTLRDFDDVVKRAHSLGLKIILDQVYSHTSDQHAWFAESRSSRDNAHADWYVWADARPDGSPPNNWQSLFTGPAWTWDARRAQYYMHNFLREQPDLNLLNPAVQTEILRIGRFWLERGVDGFRVDAVSHFTHDEALTNNPPRIGGPRMRPVDFQVLAHNADRPETLPVLERIRSLVDQFPDRCALGEIGAPGEALRNVAGYLGPGRLHSAYSFQFLRSDSPSPASVRDAVEEWDRRYDGGWPTWVFSNHDAPRVATRWHEHSDVASTARLFNALLLALRGSVCIYQGEELGLPQAHVPFERLRDPEAIANWPATFGRDGARTPMPWRQGAAHAGFSEVEPWLPVDPDHLPLSVDCQQGIRESTLESARDVIRVRRERPALRDGEIRFITAQGDVLLFERASGSDRVFCAFNLGGVDARVVAPADRQWSVLCSSACTRSGLFESIDLPPSGYLFAGSLPESRHAVADTDR